MFVSIYVYMNESICTCVTMTDRRPIETDQTIPIGDFQVMVLRYERNEKKDFSKLAF